MGEAKRRKEQLGDEYGKITTQTYFSDLFYKTYAPPILTHDFNGDVKETLVKLVSQARHNRKLITNQPMYSLAVWNTKNADDLIHRCNLVTKESFACLNASRAARQTLLDGYQLTFNAFDDSPTFGAYAWVPWSYYQKYNQVKRCFSREMRECYTQKNLRLAINALLDKQTLDYCATISLILTLDTYKEYFGLMSRMFTETWLFLMSSSIFLCDRKEEEGN